MFAVVACGSTDTPEPEGPTPSPTVSSPSATTSPEPTFSRAGCPVSDDAFCDTATRIGRALLERDAAALLGLSRSDTIDCAKVAREYFPGCADADALTGYGLASADFIVEIVPRSAYARRLEDVVSGIDPAFTDELGGGSPTVIGVGTCGPAIPRRRTYHLAWTAAIDDGGGVERHLGSFEVGFDGRDWKVILWYLDTLEAWEMEQPDPLSFSFCEAGLNPWNG
jgi:hypothetical protein